MLGWPLGIAVSGTTKLLINKLYIYYNLYCYVRLFIQIRRGWYWLADHTWTHQKDLVRRFSRPTVRRRHSVETVLVRVVNDLNTCMELGSKSVLLSLDISASFDTIDTITVWAGVSLVSFNRTSQTDHAMWPSEISGLTSGATMAFLRKASLDLSSSPPSYLQSQGSWSFTGSGYSQVSSIRGQYSTTRMLLPGFIPNGGSLTMCVGFDVPFPRQWATIVLRLLGPWSLAQDRVFPRLEPVTSDIGDGHMEVRDESKSSAFIWIQPCLWMLNWRYWSRHPTFTSVLSDTVAEVWLESTKMIAFSPITSRFHHFSAWLL